MFRIEGNCAGYGRASIPPDRFNDQVAADLLRIPPHSGESAASPSVVIGQSRAVIRHGQSNGVGVEGQLDLNPSCACVPEGVGERVVSYGEQAATHLRREFRLDAMRTTTSAGTDVTVVKVEACDLSIPPRLVPS